MSDHRQELMRIKKEYAQRDEQGISEIYSYQNPAFVFHMQERERAILNLLKQEKIDLSQSSVLEVGCGIGHVLQRFLEFGARKATGIDLMESRVRKGRQKYPNLHLVPGDASNLPFKDGEFDLVMQFMCLSAVWDPIMRQKITNEMWRVLRPGGAILFYDLRPLSRWIPLLLKARRRIYGMYRFSLFRKEREINPRSKPTPPYLISLVEIKKLFNQRAFHVQSASLDLRFASFARRSTLVTVLLSHLPFLRTHYLALIRKPV